MARAKRPWGDLCMVAYFATMLSVSAVSLWAVVIAPPNPWRDATIVPPNPWRDATIVLYAAILAVGAVAGLVGIARRIRLVAVVGVLGIAFATGIHGALAIPTDPAAGLRLIASPLMMVPAIIGWRYWMEATEHRPPEGDRAC